MIQPSTQDYNWLDFGSSPNATEDGLWQGVSGTNNPCPLGYRLPTETEMNALVSAEGITNYTNAASSSLAFSASGLRRRSDGSVSVGSNGYYWTSLVSGAHASYRRFDNSGTDPFFINRAHGFGVRCLKD